MGCGSSSTALPIGALPLPRQVGTNKASLEFWQSSPLLLSQVFAHYAGSDEDDAFLTKEGVTNLAIDCVAAWHDAARASLQKQNPKWTDQQIEWSIFSEWRPRYFPFKDTAEIETEAKWYLLSELRYQSPAGVSKAMFHLNFARSYKVRDNSAPATTNLICAASLHIRSINFGS